MTLATPATATPRLPVMGWETFRGARDAPLPSLLAHPRHRLTTSGRAAILLALECVGVGPDDVVLVPSYHCPTMVAPVLTLGAQAVFYPIDEHGAPRLDWLQTHAPARAKAMLATHYFGLPQPMDANRAWCDARGIALIEDCAHAMFGRSGARAVGAWGDVAIASLTKFFPTPEGGILAINRDDLALPVLTPASPLQQVKAAADILHMGASHDRLTGLNGLIRGVFALRGLLRRPAPVPIAPAAAPIGDTTTTATPAVDERIEDVDANMALIDLPLSHRALTAASGWISTRVPRQRIVEARRRHYEVLLQAFQGDAGFHPLLPHLPADSAPYVFPLWVRTPDPGYLEMRRLGVPVSRWDRLWPGVPALPGDTGVAWSHHVLQLACHQDLTDADLRGIVAQVRRLFSA
ncbi:DegT/DnrJ/EryC1/StrS family aminotransferase [Roseateles amylovorans]|uniref:DegT/DnrJ/EryC1/StrS family aminotransferase n=1 Tax=Roseateles amylovorans TaxID=2978473 RepID=A0ABY6BA94_9BURK|nr:DegT/DnrJ/EryC1/StrS family aminotransferase [Roseateles amylovorans]UXH80152.1 DegT/DnrJ/EryC1/StrS family aminotransferase [Roseateles amylovorans]